MKSLIPAAALLLLPTLAFGQDYCDGRQFDGNNQLSMSWRDCWWPGSVAGLFTTWNCDPTPTTNVTSTLHLQFKTPTEITSGAATATLIIKNGGGQPLSPFYHFEPTGCAGSGAIQGMSLSLDPEPSGCDAGNGFVSFCDDDGLGCSGSSIMYFPDDPSAGSGRLMIYAVRSTPKLIEPGINQWLCKLVFNNRLRNDCAGCTRPTGILFSRLGIESAIGERELCLTGGDEPKGPHYAGINGADLPSVHGYLCCSIFDNSCCPTNSAQSTWGQIKALYR